MMTPERLGPLDQEAPQAVRRMMAERNELRRIAAVSALQWSCGGELLDKETRAYVKHWAAIKPLGRPLTTGDPQQVPA